MKAIAVTEEVLRALQASAAHRGMEPADPIRSPYGHVYIWLDHLALRALEAARGPSESHSDVILRLIELEKQCATTRTPSPRSRR